MSSLGLDEMHGSRKPCLVIGIHLFPGLADFLDPISHFCSLGVHQANCKRRWFLSCLLYDQRLGLKQNHGLYAVLPSLEVLRISCILEIRFVWVCEDCEVCPPKL